MDRRKARGDGDGRPGGVEHLLVCAGLCVALGFLSFSHRS